jgi:hypothetical protein
MKEEIKNTLLFIVISLVLILLMSLVIFTLK